MGDLLPPLVKDPSADLEELFDFGYLDEYEFEEAKAERIHAHDIGGIAGDFVYVHIAQLDGAADDVEADGASTDTEPAVITTEQETISTEDEAVATTSESSDAAPDEAAPKDEATIQDKNAEHLPTVESDSKTAAD